MKKNKLTYKSLVQKRMYADLYGILRNVYMSGGTITQEEHDALLGELEEKYNIEPGLKLYYNDDGVDKYFMLYPRRP